MIDSQTLSVVVKLVIVIAIIYWFSTLGTKEHIEPIKKNVKSDNEEGTETSSIPIVRSVIRPLLWIFSIGLWLGAIAALFTTIASIIHFQIIMAVAFFALSVFLYYIALSLTYALTEI